LATKILNSIYNVVGDFENFYDLFGGGGAVSVAALQAGHTVYYNEINTAVVELLRHIQRGGTIPFDWVSREQYKKHANDKNWFGGLLQTCWSFGNNGKTYLYGKDIEQLKKEAHDYLFENGYNKTSESRTMLLKQFKKDKNIVDRAALKQLEHLERLNCLERLQRLGRLNISNDDYKNITTNANAVIYCDIPYEDTAKYVGNYFDHNEFYKWALDNKNSVFISSYKCPDDFKLVAMFEHRSTISAFKNNLVVENLYWNRKGVLNVLPELYL